MEYSVHVWEINKWPPNLGDGSKDGFIIDDHNGVLEDIDNEDDEV